MLKIVCTKHNKGSLEHFKRTLGYFGVLEGPTNHRKEKNPKQMFAELPETTTNRFPNTQRNPTVPKKKPKQHETTKMMMFWFGM